MFNDLNNANASGHAAVDDIFAETDKPGAGTVPTDIETHRVGLAANGENLASLGQTELPQSSDAKKNYLRIVIIVVIVLAVLGGAYFVYSQFFTSPATPPVLETPKVETPKTVTPQTNENNFVPIIPGSTETSTTTIEEATTSVTTTTETVPEVITPVEEVAVDSDSDGLSDAEEKVLGTNINVIDTDNDGLSDYEEVKIYLTDPLNPDTDGDTYLDGAEVKSGYDPKVKGGKLPGNTL